ncbi:NAD-dependent epimerase/dehydratase family protein [Cellulomonas sp. HZM]|uniref:NAD-dependent epimerase/dehydratase family protein n=1 Tax=Cellulomonas sp. HZM TaxID=1454010 RepID=UPI0004935D8C|nr:NAD-dependent epimerase/dehydratase family protein [Cellulomonas sp. HZM]
MARHVVLGKGPVGSALTDLFVEQGHDVVVVSRSGAPEGRAAVPGVRHVAADASDASSLARLAVGAASLVDAANPPYHRWPQLWPVLHGAAMDVAERTGAVLVTVGNLYGYGAGSGVMTEATPLRSTEAKGAVRAQMWREALARHEAGRLRATEVRASDYLGPGALGTAHAGAMLMEPLLAGRTLRPVGDPDQPHSWTYLADLVAALAAVAQDERAWGSAWVAPTDAPLSYRDLAGRLATEAGVPVPNISPVPAWMLRTMGVAVPAVREVARVRYQFTEPFVVDSSATERTLGLSPTPWDAIVRETVTWWQGRVSA